MNKFRYIGLLGCAVVCLTLPALAADKPEFTFKRATNGNCIEPANRSYVKPFCLQGWVVRTARVSDHYWARSQTWYASVRIKGVRYCTQRFFEQTGVFCAPPGFKGRFWRESPFKKGDIAAFVFDGR